MGLLRIPCPVGDDSFWTISGPWLKLVLKYGVIGGWRPNASVTFDRYCQDRGPLSQLPRVTDFAMSTLMNSRVTAIDLARAKDWINTGNNQAALASVAVQLAQTTGLVDTYADTLRALGTIMDTITALPGIKIAKTAKWFSAWAPAHVPMLDRYVLEATTDETDGYSRLGWADLLIRFQSIVRMNLKPLDQLAARRNLAVRLTSISRPHSRWPAVDRLAHLHRIRCVVYSRRNGHRLSTHAGRRSLRARRFSRRRPLRHLAGSCGA